MASRRKSPHCKTCHKPLKGHRRGRCDPIDVPCSTAVPLRAVNAKPQETVPLEGLPTLSIESSQILNDIVRVKSRSALPIQVFQTKRTEQRKSGRRSGTLDESLGLPLGCLAADIRADQNSSEEAIASSKYNESEELLGTKQMGSDPQVQSDAIPPTSCVVSQQLVVNALSAGSTIEPLTFTMSQRLKLEDSTSSGCQRSSACDVPFTDQTIEDFLTSMARNPLHPPSAIFSYPLDTMASLEEGVRSHGLYMHILPLPNEKRIPVVIGKDMQAIMRLLEDGEKLAQGLRRQVKNKSQEYDLGLSHVVVGALGALMMWATLAYA